MVFVKHDYIKDSTMPLVLDYLMRNGGEKEYDTFIFGYLFGMVAGYDNARQFVVTNSEQVERLVAIIKDCLRVTDETEG